MADLKQIRGSDKTIELDTKAIDAMRELFETIDMSVREQLDHEKTEREIRSTENEIIGMLLWSVVFEGRKLASLDSLLKQIKS